MGRAETLDAAALLIDEDKNLGANGGLCVCDEAADLIGVIDVAGEQDKSGWAGRA